MRKKARASLTMKKFLIAAISTGEFKKMINKFRFQVHGVDRHPCAMPRSGARHRAAVPVVRGSSNCSLQNEMLAGYHYPAGLAALDGPSRRGDGIGDQEMGG